MLNDTTTPAPVLVRRAAARPLRGHAALLSAIVAATLTACGGGGEPAASTDSAAASPAVTLRIDPLDVPADAAATVAEPSFHAAPLVLAEPGDSDTVNPNASALNAPRTQAVPAGLESLSTRGLTVQGLAAAQRLRALGASRLAADGNAAPLATGSVVATYTPAQIRAAYGLPALPAAGATLTAAQAAQLGAGQTIYIVDAMHDPNVASELAAFNQRFGLPGCTSKVISTATALPLAAPAAAACELSVVYSTASGGRTATAPAYNAGWATEIALDVQWAHATAPLARIVLIEAADATLNSLLGAVQLANAMGPGTVSMSFGALEGNYTASVDAAFSKPNMAYLAATGDSGAAVSWPAVSPAVLAVGGTSLSYSGSGTRSEVAWASTGGGTSAYTARPAYQASNVPGLAGYARRTVADVAFNADPATGQYVAVQSPGSSAVSWISAGGTSLSTPQWAGLLAVANAQRALTAKAALGAPHALLYGQIGAVPGSYAAAFADVSRGTHGSCATCTAKAGYDPLTGLGTPNVASLLSALGTGTTPAPAPSPSPAPTPTPTPTPTPAPTPAPAGPVIKATAMTGVAGKALSGSIAITDPGVTSLSISLSGVPAGMVFALSGLTLNASWASPVTGSYSLKVSMLDSAGRSATATVPVTVTAR